MFKHLDEEKLSYFQHMKRALLISLKLFVASILCFVHSILPFLFTSSASNICKKIISGQNE